MMNNPLKVSIQLSIIILKLFTYTADTLNMTIDLEIICSFRRGTEFVNVPPPECTSIASPNKNLEELNAIISIKGKLPLFLIDDTQDYYSWPDIVKKGASEYLSDIQQYGINYLAFENTYKDKYTQRRDRPNFSQDFVKFLDDAKLKFPDVKFGLVLSVELELLTESLDIGLLKNHVDFFLLNSAEYRTCEHNNHQVDMNVLATKVDIIGSIGKLKELGVDTSKLIYEIDLVVQSAKKEMLSVYYESMSYSQLCSKKMSDSRKYCFNTIPNLFDKAKIHRTEKTLGIYVRSTNYDDYDGKCACTTNADSAAAFRGLKTIVEASREDKNNVSFYECVQGHYPTIL